VNGSPVTTANAEPVTVRVASAAPYDVVIGRGLLDELVAATAATGASRAALIHPPTLAATAEVIRRDGLLERPTDHVAHRVERAKQEEAPQRQGQAARETKHDRGKPERGNHE